MLRPRMIRLADSSRNLSENSLWTVFFWLVTLVLSALFTGLLAVRFPAFYLLNGHAMASKALLFLDCIAAIGGSVVYNGRWCDPGVYAWWDCGLSVATGVCVAGAAVIVFKLIGLAVLFIAGFIFAGMAAVLGVVFALAIVAIPLLPLILYYKSHK